MTVINESALAAYVEQIVDAAKKNEVERVRSLLEEFGDKRYRAGRNSIRDYLVRLLEQQ